jgi:hypothetical protein
LHLHKHEIETFINEHSNGFIGSELVVEVSTGSVFAPKKLHAHFFKPKHGWESELLRQHHLIVYIQCTSRINGFESVGSEEDVERAY